MTTLLRPPPWTELAECQYTDPALFFPAQGEPATEAKKVCAGCKVQAECLDYALEHGEEGVWGGTSERDRERLTGRRPALTAVAPATDGEKSCTKCGDTKPMVAFGVDRHLPDGRKYWCRACFATNRRERAEVAA